MIYSPDSSNKPHPPLFSPLFPLFYLFLLNVQIYTLGTPLIYRAGIVEQKCQLCPRFYLLPFRVQTSGSRRRDNRIFRGYEMQNWEFFFEDSMEYSSKLNSTNLNEHTCQIRVLTLGIANLSTLISRIIR